MKLRGWSVVAVRYVAVGEEGDAVEVGRDRRAGDADVQLVVLSEPAAARCGAAGWCWLWGGGAGVGAESRRGGWRRGRGCVCAPGPSTPLRVYGKLIGFRVAADRCGGGM